MAVDDAYTKCLLHFDGSDGSTTFTDEAGHTWTANGNAQIDTAQYKFGSGSGLFDGSGDYISAPDSDDWRLDDGDNANKWTIDCWVRFSATGTGTSQVIAAQYADGNNYWRFRYAGDETLNFVVSSSGTVVVNLGNSWSPSPNTWYHVAVVKDGSNGYMMFVNGTQIGSTQMDVSPLPNISGSLFVGHRGDGNWPFSGWLDELRISKGVARWTSGFTPPSAAYGPAAVSGGRRFRAMMVG